MSQPFDPSRKFIRLVAQRADGMVEFEFAVGEPELFVEMLLPRPAFEAFCAAQGVQPLAPILPAEAGGDRADRPWSWTLHEARHHPPGGSRP